jgi:hypothetical protein
MGPLISKHVVAESQIAQYFDELLQLHQQGQSANHFRSAFALRISMHQVLTNWLFFETSGDGEILKVSTQVIDRY